jgi:hypothetical protein
MIAARQSDHLEFDASHLPNFELKTTQITDGRQVCIISNL